MYTDGVLTVFRIMWRSAGWIECLRGRIRVRTRSLAIRMMYRMSLILDVGMRVSAIRFRRLGSSFRQQRDEVVIARSVSTLLSMETTKDSAPGPRHD